MFPLLFVSALLLAADNPPAPPPPGQMVQTFAFDSLATRRATFQLPEAGPWRRILMHYTLRCDERTPGDNYPCGEWDVNTYTRVWVHTGRQDSTLHRQARFIVSSESPEQFLYSNEPRWQIVERRPGAADTRARGSYLHFTGSDHLELPAAAFAHVDSALAVCLWAKGAPEQPLADHILEASGQGGRLVNIHLPWSTGTVYWDAGGRLSGNTNRIAKEATAGEFKGHWNHWAFVKDARAGRMAIYLNGQLWHEAGNMHKSMAGIDRLVVGANLGANGGWYQGSMDELCFYDEALSATEIASLMAGSEQPRPRALIAAYNFENDRVDRIADSGPSGNHARPFGLPQHRPYGLFGTSDAMPTPLSTTRRDSIPAAELSVLLFEDAENPQSPTDTLTLWPAYDELFDADGRLLEKIEVESTDTLVQSWHEWYGEPFEVVEAVEIARFITPYGKGLDLGEDGFTWTVDVTDYAPLLRGEVELEAHNGYELLDLRFEFLPGQPPREVLAIEELWPGGDFKYGALADDEVLQTRWMNLRQDAAGYALRSRISGHGHAGPRNCCEWDAKEHSLLINGSTRFQWTLWRDCGFNPLHPQGGTWQFDRAGWCPGSFVHTHVAELTSWVEPGEQIAIDYQVEAYDPEIAEADGRYYIEHQLFSYGPICAEVDVAIDRILAPSDHDELRRLNPISTSPVVVIRNQGRRTLNSVLLLYGLHGSEPARLNWLGSLPFGAADTLVLPKPDWSGLAEGATFAVELRAPNGDSDMVLSDNRATSTCPAPTLLPQRITIHAELPEFDRWQDNAWTIRDSSGRILAQRESYTEGGEHEDALSLSPGAYVFTFTDANEDGLIRHWWLRGSNPEGIGENGRLRILDEEGGELLDLGYDFAEKRMLQFFVGGPR